jgi:hypothetical protein
MKIQEKLLRVQAAVIVDKAKGKGALAVQLGEASEKAITKGMGTPEWEAYMALFADSAEQLERLTTTNLDGTNNWLPRARAYIAANGVCSPITDAATAKGLGPDGVGDIDVKKPSGDPLDETPDPGVAAKRPFVVPPI